MAGYNRIIITGNLTRDPDYKQLTSGQAVCRLGLASNRQFKNRQTGNMVQEVCYIDIDVWGAQAESCRQYLQKGRPVLIEGRIKFDTWDDASGQTRSKHSIVADRVIFLASGSGSNNVDIDTAGDEAGDMPSKAAAPRDTAEQELFDQIEQIKNRAQAKKQKVEAATAIKPTKKAASPSGEINFKDEAPFEEELPF